MDWFLERVGRKYMRTEKSIKNLFFGIVLQLVIAAIGIVNRTVMIKYIGIQALSLNGLFTEVLAMLALAELGVGSAITYSLYKPLSTGDTERIAMLMNLYKKAYRVVATVILGIGIGLLPFIQYLVNSVSYSVDYIRLVFFLFVLQTASSYLFAYKTALISADQKQYLISGISTVAKVILAVVQISIVVITKNYIAYLVCAVLSALLTNIVLARTADKLYPYLKTDAELDKESKKQIFSNIRNVFISKVSGTITNSTDNMLISILVSTISVGLYSNYAVIINIIKGMIVQFTNAVTASFGNMMATESPEHCDQVLRRTTYITFVFGGLCTTGLICAESKLVELWLGKEFLLDSFTVAVCVFCLLINILRTPLWTIMEISGLFRENRNTGIIGSIINLLISIVLGVYFGMAGIFLGTISSCVIQGAMKVYYLYNRKLHVSAQKYTVKLICYIGVVVGQSMLAATLCSKFSSSVLFVDFFVSCLIAVGVSVFADLLLFSHTEEFEYCKSLFWSLIKRLTQNKRGGEML